MQASDKGTIFLADHWIALTFEIQDKYMHLATYTRRYPYTVLKSCHIQHYHRNQHKITRSPQVLRFPTQGSTNSFNISLKETDSIYFRFLIRLPKLTVFMSDSGQGSEKSYQYYHNTSKLLLETN